ncbi:MAG: tetratricopeptide repeat protein [Lewinellaceae bacterium]|nr:tetratricopeptide repeat protein [Lewinellaceae bacterium]
MPAFSALLAFCLFQLAACTDPLARANRKLEKALVSLDSARVDEALALGREAETLFLEHYSPEDSSMSDVYYVIGLCLLKNQDPQAEQYYHKIQAVETPASPVSRANAQFFLGNCAYLLGDFGGALEAYGKALEFYQKGKGPFYSNVPRAYSNIGVVYWNTGRYEEALVQCQKALELWQQRHGDKHFNVSIPYNNRGLVYMEQGDFAKAAESYKKALEIRMRTLGPRHPEVGATLLNIGLVENYRGEFDRSSGYFLKALDIFEEAKATQNLPAAYNNLGLAYSSKEDHQKARYYFEKTLEAEQELYAPDSPELATTLFNIASAYQDGGDIEKAKEYYFQALDIAKEGHPYLGRIYNGVGLAYQAEKQFDKAKEYFRKGYERQVALFSENHPTAAVYFYNLAAVAMEEGKGSEALKWNGQARKILGPGPGEGMADVRAPYDLLKVLGQNVRFRWAMAQKSGGRNQLAPALEACRQAIEAINFLRGSYKSKTDKQGLIDFGYAIFETAIAASRRLYQQTGDAGYAAQAFGFAESCRSLLLQEALQETAALNLPGIPEAIRQEEYELRAAIAAAKQKYEEKLSKATSNTSSEALELSSRLFDLNQQYNALKERLEAEYPEYYQARFGHAAIRLGDVQARLLRPNQTLLEYMVGDSSIFIFLVQKDKFEILETRRDPALKDWVNKLTKEGIYGYYTLPDDKRFRRLESETIRNYTQAAHWLYEQLLAPLESRLTEEIIIIPDDVLGYVPFEALLFEEPAYPGAFSDYPFWLRRHQVSYGFNATLLREMQQKQRRQPAAAQLLALAPFSEQLAEGAVERADGADPLALRDSLGPLPASGEEVAAVAELLNGQAWYGMEASLEKFRSEAGGYRVLHLSTHGKADDRLGDYAYLAFAVPGQPEAFDKLYARMIYNFSLNADMVVLSACETGIGPLQRGEGIISLSRAFAYAGARSVFTTLWPVSDARTQSLMVDFYSNLKNGQAKDAALRKAKLDFLEKNRGRGEAAHPFFWAGLIGIGDMEALR